MLLTPITKCIAEQREGWRKLDSTPSVSRQRSSASRWMAMLRGETALNHSSPRAEVVMRYLIVNGDDFGASPAINRGIMEAHLHGILTSTSLLVKTEWAGQTHFEQISAEKLTMMIKIEIGDGVTELSCHPGYVDANHPTSYRIEREAELRTLCDPRIRHVLVEQAIRLISYHDFAKLW